MYQTKLCPLVIKIPTPINKTIFTFISLIILFSSKTRQSYSIKLPESFGDGALVKLQFNLDI